MYTLVGMLLFQKTENSLKSLEYPCNLANVYLRVSAVESRFHDLIF